MAGDRYRAGQAHDGGPLENWHRVCVPWFRSRMREGTQSHCEERRQAWPARERYARHVSDLDFQQRWLRAEEDIVNQSVTGEEDPFEALDHQPPGSDRGSQPAG